MLNLQAIISVNSLAVGLLICLLLTMRHKFIHGLADDKATFGMILTNILQCILEMLTFVFDGRNFKGCYSLLLFLNSALFINGLTFSFLWIVYVILKVFNDRKKILKICGYASIPVTVMILGAIVNLFIPVFFQIGYHNGIPNVYHRTSLFVIPTVLTYIYFLAGIVIVYFGTKKSGKYLFFPVLLFLFPVLVTSIIESFVYGISLTWAGTAIGLTTLCINLQKEISSVDILSGLYNRQYLMEYLGKSIQQINAKKKLVGIFLDVDDFKSINDTYGHLTGDDAIKNIGELLRRSVFRRLGFAARYAGDEFVLLFRVKEEKEIIETIKEIEINTDRFNQQKTKYDISFSLGYAVYGEKEDSIENFINRMDKMMNEEKKRKHREQVREQD